MSTIRSKPRARIFAAVLVSTILTAGCGQQLDGVYVEKAGRWRQAMTFEGDKVNIQGFEFDYKVEGNKLKVIQGEGMVMVNTIREDGGIDLGGGIILYKK